MAKPGPKRRIMLDGTDIALAREQAERLRAEGHGVAAAAVERCVERAEKWLKSEDALRPYRNGDMRGERAATDEVNLILQRLQERAR